jgi:hypothetical protein
MENSITVVDPRQNVLILPAHALLEIRVEGYGTILEGTLSTTNVVL